MSNKRKHGDTGKGGSGKKPHDSRRRKKDKPVRKKPVVNRFLCAVPPEGGRGNYIEVRVHGELRFYIIKGWIGTIRKVIAEFKGRGVSDAVLTMRARSEVQVVVQQHLDNHMMGLISRDEVRKRVKARLEQVTVSHKEQVSQALQQELDMKAARWKQYLRRQSPTLKSIRLFADKYLAKRNLLAKESGLRTIPGAFTYRRKDAIRIRIGLDFGTSSIKAAYRPENEQVNRTIPLALNTGNGIDRYIISPSLKINPKNIQFNLTRHIDDMSWKRCLSCRSGGDLVCGKGRAACPLENILKDVPVLSDMSIEESTLFLTSVYLGYVLKHIDMVMVKDLNNRFGSDQYRCFIHMCVPIGELEKESCQVAFQDALTLADQMHGVDAFDSDQGDIVALLEHWNGCRRLAIMSEDRNKRRSRVFPEVIAEMASYANSKSAKPGTYALIDIGAGTLDINVFRWVEASKKTPVFAAYCDGTGVLALEEQIIEILNENKDQAVALYKKQMAADIFPDMDELSCLSRGKEERSVLKETLDNAFQEFCGDVAANSKKTWSAAWEKRGNESWHELGIFIGGGGAAIEGLRAPVRKGIDNSILKSLTMRPLPLPDEDEFEVPPRFPKKKFHRVSVAYGLTVAHEFEGKLRWPKDITPPNKPEKDDEGGYTNNYPRKEDM